MKHRTGAENPELRIDGLTIVFQTARSLAKILNDISLSVSKGEALGLWGESGCGKTTLLKSILGLPLASPGWMAGEIWFKGEKISPNISDFVSSNGTGVVKKSEIAFTREHQKLLRPLLGCRWRALFQEPIYSFEPGRAIGPQIVDALSQVSHDKGLPITHVLEEFDHQLRGLALEPSEVLQRTNRQLSGGQCQRIALALTLIGNPELILADEPSTMVDMETRELILSALLDKVKKEGVTLILASHNRKEILSLCDNVAVMCKGTILETVDRETIQGGNPSLFHPYTCKLWFGEGIEVQDATTYGAGMPVTGQGCPFVGECPLLENNPVQRDVCHSKAPPFTQVDIQHRSACWLHPKSETKKY